MSTLEVISERKLYAALRDNDVSTLSHMLSHCSTEQAESFMSRLNKEQRALLYRSLPKDTAAQVFDLSLIHI